MSDSPDRSLAVAPADGALGSAASAGWLRGPAFDTLFLGGTAALALVFGALATRDRRTFVTILIFNLWLLGYHHVIATYTRIAFDTESLRRHRLLVFALPVGLLGVVWALHVGAGVRALATIYLHWQWFHYTRQTYGVEQIYWRRSGGSGERRDRATWAVIYGVPLWGIVHRSAQAQPLFLDMEISYLPVTAWMDSLAAFCALAAVAYWLFVRVGDALRGELRVAHSLYVVSHITIFISGYILIERVDPGWLLVNIWHNAQYLLVVWMYNTNRFKSGVDPQHRFLSTLSQPSNAVLYTVTCIAISALFYNGAFAVIDALPVAGVSAILIFSQTVNFHHYTVDGFVWKLRRPSVSAAAGAVKG
jgi:hypothetical protein